MSRPEVKVVSTGTANLASVLAGLRRAGATVSIVECPEDVEEAARVVLPGVGAFRAAREALDDAGLAEALRLRVLAGAPTLAVCLGLQLLGTASEESPGVPGLGVVPCVAERFGDDVEVPQLGWNRISPDAGARLLEPGYAYFANTYRFRSVPAGWSAAVADHGGTFVAALERGDVLACQFHPELSGALGARLIERWLGGGAPC